MPLLGASIIAGHRLVASQALVHPVRREHVPPEAMARLRGACPSAEAIALTTADGLTLRGWFVPGSRRATVVFVHGGGGSRLQLLPEALVLHRRGYGVLVYDSRASGESDGDLVSWGDKERLDVRAAIDFLVRRPEVDPTRIGLVGFSIGASTAALEAANDPRVHALVLYATWSSLEDEIKTNESKYGALSWGPALFEMRREGVDVGAVRPIDVMARIAPRELLMIAGDQDTNTPVAVMQKVFAAARPPKELWVEHGAGHGGYPAADPKEYEARVGGFFDRALGGP
jgi:fermentation-respiration switch protein FrsA (DUF1100 family)